MIVINSGKMTIPEDDRFVGFAGDNLHTQKQFLVTDISDPDCVYRLYLNFDDGTTNYFVLDSIVENSSTLLTWNILTEHIYKSGIVNAQIKAFLDNGEIFHTTWDYFYAEKSAEEDEPFTESKNAEFLRYEKELNSILEKINAGLCVPNSRKVAGMTLSEDITPKMLSDAIEYYPVKVLSYVPNNKTAGSLYQFCVSGILSDSPLLFVCAGKDDNGYIWKNLTADVSPELITQIVQNYLEENSLANGADGKSAYEIAIDNGFEGTEQEWLDSLKGENGTDGKDGADGIGIKSITQGSQSLSDEGINTLAITLTNGKSESFVVRNGSKGDKGDKGDIGVQGPKGDKGDTGAQGKDGSSASITVSETSTGYKLLVSNESASGGADVSQVFLNHGEKGADGKTPVKGTDYFTDSDKAELVSEVKLSLDEIPAYWKDALDEGVESINTALADAGYNKSAFLFYSDAHFDYGSQMAPKLLKYLYNHTGMTKTFFGGDIVNSEAADYEVMEYLWEWRNMLKDLPNHHSVVGNHDDGNATNNLFSEQYVYSYLLASEETSDVVRDDKGLYYYIDNSPEKTRYIFLDTAYKGMTADQTAFLKETLLTTKEGWHIVVVSHIWYEPDYDRYNERPVPITGLSQDASIVTAMLDNYNSRLGEYADCKAWVEFCVGGHIHYDYDGTTSTGIPIIIVETDSMHLRGSYGYTPDTTTESSVNGIVADYDNHKISVIRIGRGQSREIEVTNYQVTYTNVLSLAVGTDGALFQGGKGYADNSRMGSSGLYIGTVNGVDCTGFIPIDPSVDQVVRFKNVTMKTDSANANYLALGVYSESFARLNLLSMANFIDSTNGSRFNLVLDGNNIKQITLPKSDISAGTKYLVICCDDINDASVITINEPIE